MRGPQEADITSSTVRRLANRNGVRSMKPGKFYPLNETPGATAWSIIIS